MVADDVCVCVCGCFGWHHRQLLADVLEGFYCYGPAGDGDGDRFWRRLVLGSVVEPYMRNVGNSSRRISLVKK